MANQSCRLAEGAVGRPDMQICGIPADDVAEVELSAAEVLMKYRPAVHPRLLILGSLPDLLEYHRVNAGDRCGAVESGHPPELYIVMLRAHASLSHSCDKWADYGSCWNSTQPTSAVGIGKSTNTYYTQL